MSAIERLASDDGRDLARVMVRELADDFRRPAFRAGLGATMLSTAILARLGARASLAVCCSLLVGAAVEQLYGMIEDVHGKLTADYVDIPLGMVVTHDVPDCRGHVQGSADALAEDCCHAAGEV